MIVILENNYRMNGTPNAFTISYIKNVEMFYFESFYQPDRLLEICIETLIGFTDLLNFSSFQLTMENFKVVDFQRFKSYFQSGI